jgi:hypothetical protein
MRKKKLVTIKVKMPIIVALLIISQNPGFPKDNG